MFGIFLNLQQTIITGVLLVMIMTPRSTDLSAGWWVEQERSPAVEYQIVRVKVSRTNWLLKIKALITHRRILLIRLLIGLNLICLGTWLTLLKLTTKLLPAQETSQATGEWLIPINASLQVGIRVAISTPAVYDKVVYETYSAKIMAVESADDRNASLLATVNSPLCVINNNQSEIIYSHLYQQPLSVDHYLPQQPLLLAQLANQSIDHRALLPAPILTPSQYSTLLPSKSPTIFDDHLSQWNYRAVPNPNVI